ncbi:sulfate transporter family protein [Bartonella schoenbuchensis]|uniref:CysZ-like protein n=1 Tax=Bartonella schoenbuchensis m07a TaxID=1094496 RepID=N6VFK0_9HYPH|nr:sulfate transporter family protein [Bartonella schoenbuchensis]ENN92525.1 CysZ-like protein [Bartonella schoenbuchensis m07a]
MIFTATYLALKRLFTPQYCIMMLKILGLTCVVFIIIWLLIHKLFMPYLWLWVTHLFPILTDWTGLLKLSTLIILNFGLVFLAPFLIAPTTAIIGSFFVDAAAEIIEKEDYPNEPVGQTMSFTSSLILSLKFAVISLLGNAIAFILFFIPGVNLIAFYVINGYMLGREYFLLSAYRFQSQKEAHSFLRIHHMTVFWAGLVIAFFVSIPIVNLVTPLFAAAFMTYLYKMLPHNHSTLITLK